MKTGTSRVVQAIKLENLCQMFKGRGRKLKCKEFQDLTGILVFYVLRNSLFLGNLVSTSSRFSSEKSSIQSICFGEDCATIGVIGPGLSFKISSLCFVFIAFVTLRHLSHLSTIRDFCCALYFALFSSCFIKIPLQRSHNLVSLLSAILFVQDGFSMKLPKMSIIFNFTVLHCQFHFLHWFGIDVFLANQNEEIVACILLTF